MLRKDCDHITKGAHVLTCFSPLARDISRNFRPISRAWRSLLLCFTPVQVVKSSHQQHDLIPAAKEDTPARFSAGPNTRDAIGVGTTTSLLREHCFLLELRLPNTSRPSLPACLPPATSPSIARVSGQPVQLSLIPSHPHLIHGLVQRTAPLRTLGPRITAVARINWMPPVRAAIRLEVE